MNPRQACLSSPLRHSTCIEWPRERPSPCGPRDRFPYPFRRIPTARGILPRATPAQACPHTGHRSSKIVSSGVRTSFPSLSPLRILLGTLSKLHGKSYGCSIRFTRVKIKKARRPDALEIVSKNSLVFSANLLLSSFSAIASRKSIYESYGKLLRLNFALLFNISKSNSSLLFEDIFSKDISVSPLKTPFDIFEIDNKSKFLIFICEVCSTISIFSKLILEVNTSS